MKLNTLQLNVIANYAGLIYATIISIAIFPLYLNYLGAAALGLIGFFTLLQAWLQLLDMGMSPMLSRQIAEARGNNTSFIEIKKITRSLEIIFTSLALLVFISVLTASEWITQQWLQTEDLNPENVKNSIMLMGSVLSLRLISSLYRSGIQGMEKQVWLNVVNSVILTFRFIGALILLVFISHDYVHFFIYQLIIGVLELIILSVSFYYFLPNKTKIGLHFFWEHLKPIIPFASGIAYTATLWAVLTQLDKTLLSRVLSLSEYGYFALVIVAAAGISQLSGPISKAILPRMTSLLSMGKEQSMLNLYRSATQITAVIIFPLAGVIALFSTELLYAWTGNKTAAEWGENILFWYALGNGVLAMSAFQYYLQFAHGKLKMHVIYNTISAAIQIPIIIYSAVNYGAIGVAITWFTLRVITFFIWTPIVHNKFAKGIHWKWLVQDIAPILLSTLILLIIFKELHIDFYSFSRIKIFILLGLIGGLIVTINTFISNVLRHEILTSFRKRKVYV
ncbi:MAG: hypothetical protein L3J59_14490 [Methylococcaceae bacterium]|nr:hypothetical protein [Methylococcaceae bacterium]